MAKFKVKVQYEETVSVTVDFPDDELEEFDLETVDGETRFRDALMDMASDRVESDLFGSDHLGREPRFELRGIFKKTDDGWKEIE